MAVNKAQLSTIMGNVQKTVEQQITRINEHAFKQRYLPLFLGRGPRDADGRLNIQAYVELVGGFHRSAYIVNNNQEILFKVPALIPQTTINTSKQHSFLKTLSLAARSRINDPHADDRASITSYNHSKIIVSREVTESIAVWNNILTYFGEAAIDGVALIQNTSEDDQIDDFFS